MKFSRYIGVISSLRSSQAFTLIEVIVAMTILALILTSVFQIYTNITTMSKRLELARWLQNNVRTITESIARDVREGGIAFRCYDAPGGIVEPGCDGGVERNYATSWSDTLILKGNATTCGAANSCYIQYYLAKQTIIGDYQKCTQAEVLNWDGKPETACRFIKKFYGELADGVYGDISPPVVLSDSATRIDTLRFYVSWGDASGIGTNQQEGKVVVTFRVSLAPYKWLDSQLAKQMVIPVQTTISQKLFTAQ
jgi:prepilin-type N-terminal cleavage/methylation domain-containing protein